MNQKGNEQEHRAKDTVKLFVYGTLRRGAMAQHYLQQYPVIQAGYRLPGYAIYDAGWYPFALRADDSSFVVGDIVQVPLAHLPILDSYEGEEYVRHFMEKEQMLMYLKANEEVEGLLLVPEGDWLTYYGKKSDQAEKLGE
jgi:gamma-glutamylcyclotransferase (GGCT)/AIG2-like uncharacterized protein YtfP